MKLLSVVLGCSLAASAASAQNVRGIVELFTSQGCSSCPPADRLMAQLARDPSLIALSFPVDYWDYLGWKDTLASPTFTARQTDYAKTRGDGEVYTPQAVIDGVIHAVGSDSGEISAAMTKAAPGGLNSVPLKLSRVQNTLQVDIGAASAADAGTVWLLRVSRALTVRVGRGENAGQRLTYTNVVRSLVNAGGWHGASETIKVPLSQLGDGDSYVVLLQAGSAARPGRIMAAAKTMN